MSLEAGNSRPANTDEQTVRTFVTASIAGVTPGRNSIIHISHDERFIIVEKKDLLLILVVLLERDLDTRSRHPVFVVAWFVGGDKPKNCFDVQA